MNKVVIYCICIALIGCKTVDPSNNSRSKQLQVQIIECMNASKVALLVDTSLIRHISDAVVKNVDSLEAITIFNIISFTSHERRGLIQINDSDKFFQYSRNDNNAPFIFKKEAGGYTHLKTLALSLAKNFNKNIDSVTHISDNNMMTDVSTLIITRITMHKKEGNCTTAIIPY